MGKSIQSSRSHNFRLQLKGKNITSLKFLSKFIREFPYISDIDIGDNKIADQEFSSFAATLEANRYIQNVTAKGMSGATKKLM